MDSNDSRQIKAYDEAERLLRLAGDLTNQIQTGKITGSAREPAHQRISHLEQQAVGWALLAGIRLPERIGPSAHEEEKA